MRTEGVIYSFGSVVVLVVTLSLLRWDANTIIALAVYLAISTSTAWASGYRDGRTDERECVDEQPHG